MGSDSKSSTSTTNTQKTTTSNIVDNRAGNGPIGGNVTLNFADTASTGNTTTANTLAGSGGVKGAGDVPSINISTTDQGAVAAGLAASLASLDVVSHALDTNRDENQVNAQTTQDAISRASGLAETVAQGQQNTSLKYILFGLAALGALIVVYAYVKK